VNFGRILFLILVLFLFSFSIGVLPGQEPVIEGYSFWFGIFFIVAVLFIIFRAQVWAEASQKGKKPMTVVHKTDKTPAYVMKQVTMARLQMGVALLFVVIVVLEYLGQHDLIMQALYWMAIKGEKLVNALLH
jgi:hypothetical protein